MPVESSDSLFDRLRAHRRSKLALLLGLTVGFCVPYIYLAHHAFFPVRTLPLLAIDRLAGFDPRWVWVYQSIYLLTSTLPWLATSREQLVKFVRGFLLLAGVCFLLYLFFPVRVPRPDVTDPRGLYAVLLFYDGPYSAFPSLHAGFLYYTLAFAWRVSPRVPRAVVGFFLGWALLILWSTLTTKEHYALDLPAGVALAAAADLAVWSSRFRTTGPKSQGGSM